MLRWIRFLKDFRCFKTDEQLDFYEGINFLVGDQGCGKSSVLKLLTDHKQWHDREKVYEMGCSPISSLSFDFEKDNPRIKSYFGDDINFQLGAMFASHGETVLALLRGVEKTHDTLIMMDEPDMALSIRSVYGLADSLQRIAKQGNQIIAAVHNPLLIASVDRVFSLEHRKWMKPSEFIESQREPSKHDASKAVAKAANKIRTVKTK